MVFLWFSHGFLWLEMHGAPAILFRRESRATLLADAPVPRDGEANEEVKSCAYVNYPKLKISNIYETKIYLRT